jgi:YYY domain-containing protein
MIEALTWWVAIEAIGAIAFPIAFIAFRFLPDRGFSFSKILGLLLLTYFLWLGASYHIVPNHRWSIFLILVLLAVASGLTAYRSRSSIASFLRDRWPHLLAMEVMFVAIFATAMFLHSYSADINYAGSEKPTDNAVLNAVMRSDYFPPKDPWLAGYSINYYYFGHTSVATMSKLTGISSSTGFNLALPLLVTLASVGIIGLIYNLMINRSRLRYALLFGLLGAIFFTILSNLEGVLELLAAHGVGSTGFYSWFGINGLDGPGSSTAWYPTEPYWWSRAYTFEYWPSQLFPFPRLRFGELRPEIMSFPFSVLAIGTILNLWRSPNLIGSRDWWARFGFLLPALAVGGVAAVHTWDAPTLMFLLVVTVVIHNYLIEGRLSAAAVRRVAVFAPVVVILAVLLFLPFYRTDFASFEGLRLLEAPSASKPQHLLLMWVPLLWLAASLAVASIGDLRHPRRMLLMALAPALLVFGIWCIAFVFKAAPSGFLDELADRGARWLSAIILAAVLSLTIFALLRRLTQGESGGQGHDSLFPLALVGTGVLILFGIEFFWAKDPSWLPRFNTSIRANMQVWLLLSVAGAFGIYHVLDVWKPRSGLGSAARVAWAVATAVILLGGFTYPLMATFSTTDDFKLERHVDGLFAMARDHPGEHAAILWLRDDVTGTPVIVEAVDLSYTAYSRVSTFTGLPTILGWDQHEFWWRGGSWEPQAGRKEAVERIYTTTDPAEAERLLEQYDAEYVYVGWLEREKYGDAGLAKFDDFMDVVFQNSEVTIYKVRDNGNQSAVSRADLGG